MNKVENPNQFTEYWKLRFPRCVMAVSIAASVSTHAQTPDTESNSSRSKLEEIVVTAQVREERIQDVPLSIHAITGSELLDRGITSLEELNADVPTLKITAYGNPNFIFMRGVGSGNNLATEQAVGTFIDGVYFGRDRAAKSQLFDLERVEVLKGPQVTLFGKNTIGGAISIITRQPSREAGGYLQVNSEFEQHSNGIEGAVSFPVSETVSARVAGRYQDDKGWVNNTLSSDGKGGAAEQSNARVSILAEPTDNLSIVAKYDVARIDGKLDPSEYFSVTPEFLAAMQSIDPAEDGSFDNHGSGPGIEPIFSEVDNQIDTSNFSLTGDLMVGDFNLKSVSAYVDYEVDAAGDADQSPLSFLQNRNNQEYYAVSQEFRLLSPQTEKLSYILGLYASDESLQVEKQVSLNIAATPGLDAAVPEFVPRLASRNQYFDQDTTTWSGYAQASLALTESLDLTAGLRYDHIEKEVKSQVMSFAPIGQLEPDPFFGQIFEAIGFGSVHDFGGVSRSEGFVSGLIRAEYRPSESIMLYAGYTSGNKAGGFDEDNAHGNDDLGEFEDESIDSFQAGAKMELGRGVINIDLFHNEFDDLQVASFDGVASFLVTNAASARSRGADIEIRQRVADNFTLGIRASYLDAEYKDYANAPGIPPAPIADLSGAALPFAPEWSFNASIAHDMMLNDNWEIMTQANLFWSADYVATFNNDPKLVQESYSKFDMRIALKNQAGWEFAIIGKNLNDRIVKTFGNPAPLSDLLGLNYFAFTEPARTVAFQIRKTF